MRYDRDRISSDQESAPQVRDWADQISRPSVNNGPSRAGTAVITTRNVVVPEPVPQNPAKKDNESVAWKDLPRKGQLAIITLARLSEPLVQTSLQAYLYYQLKWFDPSLPDSTISSQAGVLDASFMGAQFFTAMIWGKTADSSRAGRKVVLIVGLLGTSLSCIGFGFSTSFWQALVFRIFGGATNGNIGVMRTMISEIIREKKFQSRAFLLLPMTFNVGIIIGPILGGILSDPAGSYPGLFDKVDFFVKFPYALPNLVSALFLVLAAGVVWLGLEETHDVLRELPPDLGIRTRIRLATLFRRWTSRTQSVSYSSLPNDDFELASDTPSTKSRKKRYTQTLPFRRIFTRNFSLTMFAYFLFTFHVGTCNALYYVFLSTPVWDPKGSKHSRSLPFWFTGGLGLQPREVGIAMAILGVIGITLQLLIYPSISTRLGALKSWQVFSICFPVAYFLMPYLAIVPSTSTPPEAKTGVLVWTAIAGVLFIQVSARTFSLPSAAIIVNNNSTHPSVLGTVHGFGQSVSSAARTIGPMMGGYIFGYGLNHGIIGLVWWILTIIGVCACLASLLVREGDGHEIWLEGDDEDE